MNVIVSIPYTFDDDIAFIFPPVILKFALSYTYTPIPPVEFIVPPFNSHVEPVDTVSPLLVAVIVTSFIVILVFPASISIPYCAVIVPPFTVIVPFSFDES